MSRIEFQRWERRVRPAALYGLICFPFVWVFGVVANVNDSVGAWMRVSPVTWLIHAWEVTVVISLTVTFFVAMGSVVQDKRLGSRSRTVWGGVLLTTTLIGGALFVVSRWRQKHRASPPPRPASTGG